MAEHDWGITLRGSAGDAWARYRVEVLHWAEVGPDGVTYREGRDAGLRPTLRFVRVLYALAAQVGEPEGVCTIVFDLVVERKPTDCLVCRFDADLGAPAQAIARALVDGLGRDRCSRSLTELATEGTPTRAYADLDSLAVASLEELGL